MNSRTRRDLIAFLHEVEKLTAGLLPVIGLATASEILESTISLKKSLETDETILEVR
jgi:uncharacterized protein YwlG (UPF0340 family)